MKDKTVDQQTLEDAIQSLALPPNTSVNCFIAITGRLCVRVDHEHEGQLRPFAKALDRLNTKCDLEYTGLKYTLCIYEPDKLIESNLIPSLKIAYNEESAKFRESLFYINDSRDFIKGIFALVGAGGLIAAGLLVLLFTASPLGPIAIFVVLAAIVGQVAIGIGIYYIYNSIESGKHFTGGDPPLLEDNPEIKALVHKAMENYNTNHLDLNILDEIHEKYLKEKGNGKTSKIDQAEEAKCYEDRVTNCIEYDPMNKNPSVPGYVSYLKLFDPRLEFKRVNDDSCALVGGLKNLIVKNV